MKQLIRELPLINGRWISIHDMHLSRITFDKNSTVFYFDEGFDYIENDQVIRTKRGYIELLECQPSDFFCYYIERKPTKTGLKIKGKSISVEKISKMIAEDRVIEVFLELYDFNHFYWRGELLPYKKTFFRRLSPVIVIESMDFYTMRYFWE